MSNIVTNLELSELYTNYKPAFDNLYKVEIFSAGSNSNDTSIDNINLENYICFHTYSVSFNGESLSLERDNVTKNFKLKNSNSYTRTDTLTLGWRENISWDVKQYHDNWLARFYDKENDCYISYNKDPDSDYSANVQLYRNIRVTLMNEEQDTSKYKCVVFKKVLPNTTGGISLGWKESPSIVSHNINYYVTEWEIIPYNESVLGKFRNQGNELFFSNGEETNDNIYMNNSSLLELQKGVTNGSNDFLTSRNEELFTQSISSQLFKGSTVSRE